LAHDRHVVFDHGGLQRVEASSLATFLLTCQPFCDRDGLTRQKETGASKRHCQFNG
jgi:hypothetical protein